MLWCVSSPFLYIVTRATTRERKPNGSLPKLWGVPYKFWGYKNKINSSWFDDKKRTYGTLLQYSSCSKSETLVAAGVMFVWQHWMIDFDIDQLWYWKRLMSTIIYMDNGHWRHGLVWTMDIEDVWSMDIEEYIEYWWYPYMYIHYCSWYQPWH